jgi:ArsR family transcriptional regulator, arsenate/arsenite/antimonite-responsive transcriptional repressor
LVEPLSVPKSPVLLPMLEPPGQQSTDIDERAGRLLKLLADPTRRRIFLALLGGETCNCELADEFGLAENLISHHIRQLREAGFVRERRDTDDARWIYYSVDEDAYRGAWLALSASLDPSRIGTRSPICGPRGRT